MKELSILIQNRQLNMERTKKTPNKNPKTKKINPLTGGVTTETLAQELGDFCSTSLVQGDFKEPKKIPPSL